MRRPVIVMCALLAVIAAGLTACQAKESQAASATISSFGGPIEFADDSKIHLSITGYFPDGEDRGCDFYIVEPWEVDYQVVGRDAEAIIFGDLTCGE